VSKPWLAIDIDDTLAPGGCYPGFNDPYPDARSALQSLKAMGFNIMLWSNRTSRTGIDGSLCDPSIQHAAIKQWCDKHELPFDYIGIDNKPVFVHAFVDNRAHRFKPSSGWFKVVDNIQMGLEDMGIKPFEDKSKHILELTQ